VHSDLPSIEGLLANLNEVVHRLASPAEIQVSYVEENQFHTDELALEADPAAIQSLLIVPGWTAPAEVMPFWRAMLGYVPRIDSPDEDLVDPHNRGTGFWFERMHEPRPDGGGAIHIAIFVPYEQAEARIKAALAAGGRMVRDQFAPQWWTLADAAGNEADIATTKGRD